MVSVVIHSNPHLANQMESSMWLREGFAHHGIDAEITPDKQKGADIHVVQGPHYAYREWLGKENVLFLNRCFMGHSRFDVSIGWLQADGTRDFRWQDTPRRNAPELKPLKPEKREADQCAVVFGDYGRDNAPMMQSARNKYGRAYYRPHPASRDDIKALAPNWTLEQVWDIADVAVGHSSTVLIDAAINGLGVDCHNHKSVAHFTDREQRINQLTWADWNHAEIQRGDFWDHLCI